MNTQCGALDAATLSDSAIPFHSSQLVDPATGNAEPLEPRLSLTANKCEGKRCEQLHLMIFGGTSDETVIAETTLGKHSRTIQCAAVCSLVFLIYTQLKVLIFTRKL